MLLEDESTKSLQAALNAAKLALRDPVIDQKSAKLTYVALLKYANLNSDKPVPNTSTKLKEAVVRTGAYYFGPMFVLNKGTSTPSSKIYQELFKRGFYIEPLKMMNNAQLNLFFITLKCVGLVSEKTIIGYLRYGV